jgi:hypothetical protein
MRTQKQITSHRRVVESTEAPSKCASHEELRSHSEVDIAHLAHHIRRANYYLKAFVTIEEKAIAGVRVRNESLDLCIGLTEIEGCSTDASTHASLIKDEAALRAAIRKQQGRFVDFGPLGNFYCINAKINSDPSLQL